MAAPGTAVIRLAERAVRAAQDHPWSLAGAVRVLIVDADPRTLAEARLRLGGGISLAGCASPGEALGLLATERFAVLAAWPGPGLPGLRAAAARAGCALLALPLSRQALALALAAPRAP